MCSFNTVSLYYFESGWSPQIDGVQVDIKSYLDPQFPAGELFVLREKELFDLAILPKGKKYVMPEERALVIDEVNTCVRNQGKALEIYKKHKLTDESHVDHQLFSALDTADCMQALL